MNQITPDGITAAAEGASADMQADAGNVSQSCPAVTLNIGVFFDGTGNNAENTQNEGSSASYNSAMSNVALMTPLYKAGSAYDEQNSCGSVGTKYDVLYVQGIGTRAGWSDYWPSNIVGAATGLGLTGVEARVYSACREIGNMVNRLSPGIEPKEVILDVFGFSRGAAAARYFVNCFRQGYIMYWAFYTVPQYAYLPEGRNIKIRFVGIYDTVAAIGTGGDDDNGAVNVHVSAAQADKIYHLTAKHEYRTNFRLNHNLPGGGDHKAMLGAHSDVGGGYNGTGDSTRVQRSGVRSFSTRAAANAARQTEAATAAAQRTAQESFWIQDGWIRPNEPIGGLVNEPSSVREVIIPNRFAGVTTRYSYNVGAMLERPWVEVGLSRIPLKVMYDQAVAAGVPLLSLPTGGEYQIPPALATLAGSLPNGGPLPVTRQTREILRNFGHVSSNYGSIGMAPQEGTGSQRMWHRTIYPNDTGEAK